MINPDSLDLSELPAVSLTCRSSLPSMPCIYFAIDSLGAVQYIGKTVNAQQRWTQHHRYKQLKEIGGVRIAYLLIESDLLTKVESALIAWFKPPLNDSPIIGNRKISVYLEPELLEWFQEYCKTQERSISAQLVFMIKQLKQSEGIND